MKCNEIIKYISFPSFYADQEEDKVKAKVVDKRPKESNDSASVSKRIEEKVNDLRKR